MKSAEGLLSKIASSSNEGELNVLSKRDINGFAKTSHLLGNSTTESEKCIEIQSSRKKGNRGINRL